MNVLLTGGAGFIGSHTAVELINTGYQPIIIDDFRNSKPFILKNIEKIVGQKVVLHRTDCGNLQNLKAIFKEHNPVGIIHFAADKAVNESVINPLKYYQNNIANLINLLKVTNEFKINSFVFSSSCTVYGAPKNIPVNEKNKVQPTFSPYGYTKQVGEKILTDFFHTKPETTLTLLRYFNPIGAHPSALIGELPLGVPSNLVPFITQSAIGKIGPLTIHGNDYATFDGTCIRDYIHVVDLATAHVLSLNNQSKEAKFYNVGMGKGSSVLEVVKKFEQVNNLKLKFQFGKRRKGDVPEIYADTSLIKKELKWKPIYNLEDCLKHSWKWQKNLSTFKY